MPGWQFIYRRWQWSTSKVKASPTAGEILGYFRSWEIYLTKRVENLIIKRSGSNVMHLSMSSRDKIYDMKDFVNMWKPISCWLEAECTLQLSLFFLNKSVIFNKMAHCRLRSFLLIFVNTFNWLWNTQVAQRIRTSVSFITCKSSWC